MNRRAIYKYTLEMTDTQYLSIPGFQKALSVQLQKGIPCLWAIVNADERDVYIRVRIVGTGCRFEDVENSDYVGTFQMHNGEFVWHVFVDQKEEK